MFSCLRFVNLQISSCNSINLRYLVNEIYFAKNTDYKTNHLLFILKITDGTNEGGITTKLRTI